MSYDFLQNYNIPTAQRGANNYYDKINSTSTMQGAYGTYSMHSNQSNDVPAVNTAYYGYGSSSYYPESYVSTPRDTSGVVDSSASTTAPVSSSSYYNNPDRFLPPAKQGTGYKPYKKTFKRKNKSTEDGGSAAKKEAPIEEVTSDGKLVLFTGRDESYPDELNALIHPLSCDLCNIKMNSRIIAKDHYQSKAHDKHISAWLAKNYTDKGLNPPAVKRFIKQGPSGPDAFYCEACDLKLTSLTHANQHYAGRKHRLVVAKVSKPSGAGFYNAEGKWVRTGTKLTPNNKDRRFGIGDSFQYAEFLKSSETYGGQTDNKDSTTSVADTTTTVTSDNEANKDITNNSTTTTTTTTTTNTTPNVTVNDPTLFCTYCNISVTSALQMTMHLSGTKHKKKLKLAGIDPETSNISAETVSDILETPVKDNVLLSAMKEEVRPDPNDLSMYRTPSGQYYCKTCNTSMSHLSGLEQHLKGKRHLKKLTEDKAMAALAAKKSKS